MGAVVSIQTRLNHRLKLLVQSGNIEVLHWRNPGGEL